VCTTLVKMGLTRIQTGGGAIESMNAILENYYGHLKKKKKTRGKSKNGAV